MFKQKQNIKNVKNTNNPIKESRNKKYKKIIILRNKSIKKYSFKFSRKTIHIPNFYIFFKLINIFIFINKIYNINFILFICSNKN